MGEVKTRGRCRTPHLELAAARHSDSPGALDSCSERTKNPGRCNLGERICERPIFRSVFRARGKSCDKLARR